MSARTQFILRRFGAALLIAFAAISLSFLLFRALPGDAAARLDNLPQGTPEVKAALRKEWGLDKPLAQQYVIYLKQLVQLDLGLSFQDNQPVSGRVWSAVRNTIPLVLVSQVIAIGLGLALGICMAYRQGSRESV